MKPFPVRYRDALNDPNVRTGLLGFQRSWRETRDAQVAALETEQHASFDTLRDALAATKDRVVADLDAHIAAFRRHAEAAGATVTEAADAEAANTYIADLCRARGITRVVKGKSMASEEIELNDALAARGITAVETDLGEWILQLDADRPSHLVMPAIHRRRGQVADVLGNALGRHFDPDDIPAMVHSARDAVRRDFLGAGLGVTGANALIAESGSVMLITNEGNGRLTSSLPPIHVVTVGVEKIVPTFADAVAQLRLLPRSATGQPITTYTTFITGPSPGHELHIVLIDNGRRAMAADPAFAEALRCIRCGACANVCPPYQIVGGHAFGHIYPGAIGLVTTPFHHGLDAGAEPQELCISCGACATACPVAIPLPRQILHVRQRVVAERGLPRWKRAAVRVWASPSAMAATTRAGGLAAAMLAPVSRVWPRTVRLPGRWLRWRTPPLPARRPARARPALRAPEAPRFETAATGRPVTLFLQCLADRLLPDAAVASARLLRAAGAQVHVPDAQHCCGLPALDAGDLPTARRMARHTIAALEGDADVVTPAPSCAIAIRDHYPELLRDDPDWAGRARQLAARIHDLATYLDDGPARLPEGALTTAPAGEAAPAVHRFCQSSNVDEAGDRVERLVARLCGVDPVPLAEADVCCGFGGFASVQHPEVAEGILSRKLACLDDTGAATVLTANPGCILHLRGGVRASGRRLAVRHYAEYLADRLPPSPTS